MPSRIEARIRTVDSHTAAFVAMKGPYRLIEGAVRKMIAVSMEKGYTIVGMPVGVLNDMPGEAPKDEQLWEVRLPVDSSAVAGTVDEHGVGIKTQGSFQFAYAAHTGSLKEARTTIAGVVEWIKENGYEIAGPLEEVYLTDPAGAAPEEFVTEVGFPVAEASGL